LPLAKGRRSDPAAFSLCGGRERSIVAGKGDPQMQGMGDTSEACPFEFNFDAATFKVGDMVSYRVTGNLAGFPFVGTLAEVHDDYVIIAPDPTKPEERYRGTRESRPEVDESEIG
jgi:hypothetical protein